jgi:hypothetical protein
MRRNLSGTASGVQRPARVATGVVAVRLIGKAFEALAFDMRGSKPWPVVSFDVGKFCTPHQFGYSSYDARARSINWPRRGLCRGRHASSSRRLTPADLTGRRPLPSYVHPVLARSMTALDSASMRRRILHPHKKEPRGPSVEVSCKDTHVRARGERAVCRKGDRS